MVEATPGPWRASGIDVVTQNGKEVCRCSVKMTEGVPVHLIIREAEANALLLAQAPALLELCERLLGVVINHAHPSALWAADSLLDQARETVKKARGE